VKSRSDPTPSSPYTTSSPPNRRLRVFAKDPSLARNVETAVVNEAVLEVPWEVAGEPGGNEGLHPGPVGEYLEVVDYDPTLERYFKPIDLNDPNLLAQDGLAPSDGNPQFHQQMVYAVAMRTIRNFERALGRRALWAPRTGDAENGTGDRFVQRLRIYPHALREPNAYYSPRKKALLFGYFPARPASPAEQLPGGVVFSCLSHDIVAHETAHALLDGMHRRFTERSNADVLAFHEAFADIVALFQQFSIPDILRHVIATTRGDLSAESILVGLAHEFGRATGRRGALRSAIGVDPNPELLEQTMESHDRGALLVAAVFDAFLSIYARRTQDLVRLATGGTGILPDGAIHPDLVSRLTREAAKSAQHVLTMCIRALDYLPPVDVTFGEYLRALITADCDLVPYDRHQYRVAFMEAFRRRGIYPRNVRSLSEESLRWQGPDLTMGYEDQQVFLGRDLKEHMSDWNLDANRAEIFEKTRNAQEVAKRIIERTRDFKQQITVGLDLYRLNFKVHSIRPVRRTGPEGRFLMDAVVAITQRVPGSLEGPLDLERRWSPGDPPPDFWFRGGCNLIIDLDSGRLRHCIFKRIDSERRYLRQQAYLGGDGTGASLTQTYFGLSDAEDCDQIFAFLHRG